MQDRPSGQMVRCSKARAMFAMRACRKSVMVGMPLTKSQMTSVSESLGEPPLLLTFEFKGCSTYGDHGPALELPSWEAHHETYV